MMVAALLGAVVGVVAAPHAGSAANQKQCLRSCKQERRACLKKFKDQAAVGKDACDDLASAGETKNCKAAEQRAYGANKQQCKALLGDVCKPCCREGINLVD
jgi:hypothetical protein